MGEFMLQKTGTSLTGIGSLGPVASAPFGGLAIVVGTLGGLALVVNRVRGWG